jgi:hypothetical protein
LILILAVWRRKRCQAGVSKSAHADGPAPREHEAQPANRGSK